MLARSALKSPVPVPKMYRWLGGLTIMSAAATVLVALVGGLGHVFEFVFCLCITVMTYEWNRNISQMVKDWNLFRSIVKAEFVLLVEDHEHVEQVCEELRSKMKEEKKPDDQVQTREG
jgi:predicted Rossmann-fold nucleotide-binding protein